MLEIKKACYFPKIYIPQSTTKLYLEPILSHCNHLGWKDVISKFRNNTKRKKREQKPVSSCAYLHECNH